MNVHVLLVHFATPHQEEHTATMVLGVYDTKTDAAFLAGKQWKDAHQTPDAWWSIISTAIQETA